jgi:hypothetical protein
LLLCQHTKGQNSIVQRGINDPSYSNFGFDRFQTNSSGTIRINEQAASGTLNVSSMVTVVDTGDHLISDKISAAEVGYYAGQLANLLGWAQLAKSSNPTQAAQIQTAIKFVEKLLYQNENF